uniref:FAD-binding FR-type domain-containing protein n=1 Tax=Globisporangium ultimum (strain ATCC 200006 / CBS 805.95 / DAOM BR144) TaxID=431595 RepID=K3WVH8_GLOUD
MASLTNGTRRFMLDSLCSEDRESELLSGLSFSEAYIPSFLLNEEKRPVPVEQSSTNEAGGAAMAYRTPKANMAMLSNQSDQFRPEAASLVLSIRSAEDSVSDEGKIGVYAQRLSIYKTNTGASCVAWTIGGCFVGYVVALLVFFTRFYQKTIVPWILEILQPYLEPYQTKEDVAARVPRVYLNATWGEIGFMLLLLAIDTFIFNQVLVRDEISSLSTSAEMCRAMGKSCGYICLFTMLWLLLLMTKDSFWREFFHLPYPLGMKYRRWLGTLTLMFAVLHAVCHAVSLYLRHELIAQLVPHFGAMYKVIPIRDANGVNAFGEVALVAMVLMTAVSIPVIRKKFYAWYLSAQQILGTIVVLAVCVHFQMALWWLFPALLLFIMQKVVAGSHARYPVEIVDMAPLPNGMTRLICKRSKDAHAFTAGQFVYLYASRISWFQWHPFYVASGPRAHDDTFKVYVQAAGDWTDSFFDLSKLAYATQEAPAIYADGFYGPSHSSYYEQYGCVVLFAEGIGATGVIAMLEELFLSAKRSTAGTDVDGTHTQVWFLWVCQDVCLFKEFEPLLMEIRAWDPREKHFRLRLFLTKVPTLMEIKYTCPPPCNFIRRARAKTMETAALKVM